MSVNTSSSAARIAVVTTDESVILAAQDGLASDYHTTLLDSHQGVMSLHHQTPLEAVLLDLDTAEASHEGMSAMFFSWGVLYQKLISSSSWA